MKAARFVAALLGTTLAVLLVSNQAPAQRRAEAIKGLLPPATDFGDISLFQSDMAFKGAAMLGSDPVFRLPPSDGIRYFWNVQPSFPVSLPEVHLSAPMPTRVEISAGGGRWFGPDLGLLLAQGQPAGEAPSEADRERALAEKLANPISDLISVPFQQNIEFGIGPQNAGWHDLMNIQPVIPFSLNETWNLIARAIIPVVYQNEIFPGAGSQFGLSDSTFEFFFSPKAPTKGGIIWGVGPVLFAPTGTDPLLSARTWSAGPTGVALKQIRQEGGTWTIGILAFQIWPFAGAGTVNNLFLQPFISYTFKNTVTLTVQTQATYDWIQGQWTVPLIGTVAKIFKFGDQLVQFQLGPKYYIDRPVTAPQWGFQFNVTLLFPEK